MPRNNAIDSLRSISTTFGVQLVHQDLPLFALEHHPLGRPYRTLAVLQLLYAFPDGTHVVGTKSRRIVKALIVPR